MPDFTIYQDKQNLYTIYVLIIASHEQFLIHEPKQQSTIDLLIDH